MEFFVYGRDKRNLKSQRKTTALGQADLVPRGLAPRRRPPPISCCQHRDELQELRSPVRRRLPFPRPVWPERWRPFSPLCAVLLLSNPSAGPQRNPLCQGHGPRETVTNQRTLSPGDAECIRSPRAPPTPGYGPLPWVPPEPLRCATVAASPAPWEGSRTRMGKLPGAAAR